MLFKSLVAGVAFLAATASAQTTTSNSTINPANVDLTTRNQWCQAELNTCLKLCSNSVVQPNGNTCSADTLTYNCTCAANNSAPALALYLQTLPTLICEEIHKECIANNPNDAAAQAKCNADEKANCGTIDPSTFKAPAASSSSSSTTSAPTGSATDSSSPSTSSSVSSSSSHAAAATMIAFAGQIGSGILAAGGVAAFGMLL